MLGLDLAFRGSLGGESDNFISRECTRYGRTVHLSGARVWCGIGESSCDGLAFSLDMRIFMIDP
jgi:hypothetical protein